MAYLLLIVLAICGGGGLAAYIVASPTVPHWVKLLLNIAIGIAIFAVICFLIFIIAGIVAHI